MQIEAVRRLRTAEVPGQVRERFVRFERDHLREVRVVGHERRHRALGDVDQLRIGVAAAQHPDERGGEEDVADGAEADEEDAQHAANVLAFAQACRVPRAFSGLTTKSMDWPRTAGFSKGRASRWSRRRTATTPSPCCGASRTASFCSTSRCPAAAASICCPKSAPSIPPWPW